MFEATGLTADSLELFGIFSEKDMYYVYPNGDEVSNVDVVFLCKNYHGPVKIQEEEVERLEFFVPEDIPENLSPPI